MVSRDHALKPLRYRCAAHRASPTPYMTSSDSRMSCCKLPKRTVACLHCTSLIQGHWLSTPHLFAHPVARDDHNPQSHPRRPRAAAVRTSLADIGIFPFPNSKRPQLTAAGAALGPPSANAPCCATTVAAWTAKGRMRACGASVDTLVRDHDAAAYLSEGRQRARRSQDA